MRWVLLLALWLPSVAAACPADLVRQRLLPAQHCSPAQLRSALQAFQAWQRLPLSGRLDRATRRALQGAGPLRPRSRRGGRRAELWSDRGLLLLVEDGQLVFALRAAAGPRVPPGQWWVQNRSREAAVFADRSLLAARWVGRRGARLTRPFAGAALRWLIPGTPLRVLTGPLAHPATTQQRPRSGRRTPPGDPGR